MTPAEILERAADALDKHGHIKRRRGDVESGFCVAGAMHFVYGLEIKEPYPSSGPLFEAWVALYRSIGGRSPWMWNDDQERTKEDVTSTLRAAAAMIRAQADRTVAELVE